VSAPFLSPDLPLAERFSALGDLGLFRRLSEPSSLREGCDELARLAYAADELGVFISIIAAAGLGAPILREGGTATRVLLEDALAGRAALAVAITEPEAGSDVMGMQTTLRRGSGDACILQGKKWHVTNAPVADAIVVFAMDATTDDRFPVAVLVRPTDPGVTIEPPLELIGCHGSPTGGLTFDGVRLTADRIVGRPQDGKKLLELAFLRERVLAPWPLLGKMERVIEECLDHVESRKQFGHALHEFQFVQEKILSSFERMLHARHLADLALDSVVRGEPSATLSSLAKSASADAAAEVFRSAIEVFGSYGVQASRRFGGYLDDALCAQIAGGTRETHKKIVFGELRLDRARARRGARSRLMRFGKEGSRGG
jgi:isovaleryl-CoA dehydrogenase